MSGSSPTYDALLLVSFGGPEGPDDVMPFLERVTAGRGVPRERLEEVAEHYHARGGVSPINGQNRELLAALRTELADAGLDLPLYWGNRNWDPLLGDVVARMADDGIGHALAFVTSAYSSFSGCRQYREDIEAARAQVGPRAPRIDKLRVFYNHPEFVAATARRLAATLDEVDESLRADVPIAFCAHSVPVSMAAGSDYEAQLRETARLVLAGLGATNPWELVWQSRSGPPQVPWLEPDICDHITDLASEGARAVVVAPIGFLSDHMEVVHDLDTEAAEVAASLGVAMHRMPTVGTEPGFVRMIRMLAEERMGRTPERLAIGGRGPNHDVCPLDCCPAPKRPARPG
ncbi:MAG: ferrochelatase [Actinomycetota bacterium]|nr:ferrochelatase [Actinomycetota bacterium]